MPPDSKSIVNPIPAQDITGIIAGLAAVQAVLGIFVDEFRDHRRTTEAYRRDNTIVVGALSTALNGVATQVGELAKRIDELEPKVAGHASKFSEITGGVKVGGAIWAALGCSTLVASLLGFLAARAFHF